MYNIKPGSHFRRTIRQCSATSCAAQIRFAADSLTITDSSHPGTLPLRPRPCILDKRNAWEFIDCCLRSPPSANAMHGDSLHPRLLQTPCAGIASNHLFVLQMTDAGIAITPAFCKCNGLRLLQCNHPRGECLQSPPPRALQMTCAGISITPAFC